MFQSWFYNRNREENEKQENKQKANEISRSTKASEGNNKASEGRNKARESDKNALANKRYSNTTRSGHFRDFMKLLSQSGIS